MRGLRCATTVALVLFLIPVVTRGQVVERGAESRREVRGVVTDSVSKQPIANAEVLIVAHQISVRTDSAGRYHIAALLPAQITISVRIPGFTAVSRAVDVSRGSGAEDFALGRFVPTLQDVSVRTDTVAKFLGAEQARTTMSASDINEKRGQTLGETMKDMPGVSIIQFGPSIAKPVVRGLHSQRIATINNGVPQEGQQWGGEHAPEIDGFAANEIEVIRGPGTILYGSGALGGVVRVMPRPLPTAGGVTGEFSTNGFANNRQAAGSLLLEGTVPAPELGLLGWRVQASGRRAGDASAPGYYLPNTGFKEFDYSAAAGTTRSWGRTHIDFSHFGTDLGMYVGAHVGNLDDLERAMEHPLTSPTFSADIARPNQIVYHDLISWQTVLGLRHGAWAEVSYGFQHNIRREYDNHGFAVGARPAFALELYTHTVDVQYHQAATDHFSGSIGVSGMRQGNLSPGRSFLIPQYRLYTGGVFGLENFTISRLTLTAGARFDYRWQHAYQYGAPVIVSPEEQRAYEGTSGSAGISYRISDSWSLSGTAARAWRPPNVSERFSSGVHHGTAQYELGDTSLVPERSLNTDVTLRQHGAHTRLEVSAFRNHIDDFIFLEPRDPVSTVRGAYPAYQYAQANALLRGFEITGQLNPAAWLELYANGNVVRGTDRATGTPLYDMPADRLTSSVRLYGRTNDRVVSPFVEVGSTIVRRQDQVPTATIYKLPTDGYALLNVEVGAAGVQIGRTRVVPSFAVRNLLDTKYRDYLSRYRLFVNEPGRDFVLRLTMPFGANPR